MRSLRELSWIALLLGNTGVALRYNAAISFFLSKAEGLVA